MQDRSTWRAVAVSAVVLALGAGACSTPPPVESSVEPPPPTAIAPDRSEPYDVDAEGSFPPPPEVPARAAFGWRDTLQTPQPAPRSQRSDSTRQVENTAPDSADAAYRVQVAACSTLDLAQDLQRELRDATALSVYIVHEPPYFKVHVGDCANAAECRILESRLRADGWESAWIVPARSASP